MAAVNLPEFSEVTAQCRNLIELFTRVIDSRGHFSRQVANSSEDGVGHGVSPPFDQAQVT